MITKKILATIDSYGLFFYNPSNHYDFYNIVCLEAARLLCPSLPSQIKCRHQIRVSVSDKNQKEKGWRKVRKSPNGNQLLFHIGKKSTKITITHDQKNYLKKLGMLETFWMRIENLS